MDDAFIPIVGVVFFHFLSLPVDFFFSKVEASLSIACDRQPADHYDYYSGSKWQNFTHNIRLHVPYPARARKRREYKRIGETRAGRVCFSLLPKCIWHFLEYFIIEQSTAKLFFVIVLQLSLTFFFLRNWPHTIITLRLFWPQSMTASRVVRDCINVCLSNCIREFSFCSREEWIR